MLHSENWFLLLFKKTSRKYEISISTFRGWLLEYKSIGSNGFDLKHNNRYTEDFKINVVKSYLSGEGSYAELAIEYEIPSQSTVPKWVSLYNSIERPTNPTSNSQIIEL